MKLYTFKMPTLLLLQLLFDHQIDRESASDAQARQYTEVQVMEFSPDESKELQKTYYADRFLGAVAGRDS